MRERGLEPSARLLAYRVTGADSALTSQLQITPGDPVVSFTRLRLASIHRAHTSRLVDRGLGNSEAMAVETVWIPQALVPGLNGGDLGGSLHELLGTRYRIVSGAANVSIESVLPDQRVRELLTITEDQACLRLRMIDSDSRGNIIMVANCFYRGDKYQLTAQVSGRAFTPEQAGNS